MPPSSPFTLHSSPPALHSSPFTLHFFGTNGWYDTQTGNTICIVTEHADFIIVLDAGNGIYKLDTLPLGEKPIYLILSHLHLDHVCGLHILNKFEFKGGVKIFVPAAQKSYLANLLSPPYTIDHRELPFAVSLHELPEESDLMPCPLEVALMKHSVPTIGMRLRLGDRTVVYCPDTGFCSEAVALAREADVLIAECAFLPGMENPEWPHLNPETAARLAAESRAKRLILVHFDAFLYQTLEKRE